MTDPESQPTEEEVRDFLARLDEFHDALPDNQKPMLEGLFHAALSHADSEVTGFTSMSEYPTFALILVACIGGVVSHEQQNQQQSWMTPGVKPTPGPWPGR